MADEIELKNAGKVFNTLCKVFDDKKWQYNKNESDPEMLSVHYRIENTDLSMEFYITVDANAQLIRVYSPLPFTIPEDKRMHLVLATCELSCVLMDGNFDYNINEGKIAYRLTATFINSEVGEELIDYLTSFSIRVVNRFSSCISTA